MYDIWYKKQNLDQEILPSSSQNICISTQNHVCVCVCVWCGGGLFNIDDAMANFQFLTAFRVSSALKYIIYDFHIFFILKIFY